MAPGEAEALQDSGHVSTNQSVHNFVLCIFLFKNTDKNTDDLLTLNWPAAL